MAVMDSLPPAPESQAVMAVTAAMVAQRQQALLVRVETVVQAALVTWELTQPPAELRNRARLGATVVLAVAVVLPQLVGLVLAAPVA